MTYIITEANALHIPVADETVQTVVTSPPYYGLREYGTARWSGGNPDCDHKGKPVRTHAGFNERYTGKTPITTDKQSELREVFKGDTCPKCGAIRIDEQLGLEQTPAEYIANMVAVFSEVWRVLRPDGTLWLNMGDSYVNNPGNGRGGERVDGGMPHRSGMNKTGQGLPAKNLLGMPWRLAFALQDAGWILRRDIIWSKPNPMPESVTDRPTTAHEYIFLFAKQAKYYYDAEAVKVPAKESASPRENRSRRDSFKRTTKDEAGPGQSATDHRVERAESDYDLATRSLRSVWEISCNGFKGAHFATFPEKLVEPCILAGTSAKGCCPECRAPWERVVEKQTNTAQRNAAGKHYDGTQRTQVTSRSDPAGDFHDLGTLSSVTTGWRSTCKCNAGEPIPCLVLDPFSGSGTTGRVASRLRRDFIGTELNREYIQMKQERLTVQVEMNV